MKLMLFTLMFFGFEWATAVAPPGSLKNEIELEKGSYVVLQVTTEEKQVRKFLIGCELKLPGRLRQPLQASGVSYVPLKIGKFQSLINYWLKPAVDNYITCVDKSKKI